MQMSQFYNSAAHYLNEFCAPNFRGVTRCAVKGGRGLKIPPPKFPFWYTPNKFQWFQKVTNKQQQQQQEKVLCSFSYLSPFHFKFFSYLFTIFSSFPSSFSIYPFFLFSLFFPFHPLSLSLPFFPLPSFFLISPSFQNFPKTFQGWATRPPRPPLVTPLPNFS